MRMAAFWPAAGLVLRAVCYLSLGAVLLAMLALAVSSGVCVDVATGVPRCGRVIEEIGKWGLAVMLVASVAGVPLLLAIAGAVLLVLKLLRRSRAAR